MTKRTILWKRLPYSLCPTKPSSSLSHCRDSHPVTTARHLATPLLTSEVLTLGTSACQLRVILPPQGTLPMSRDLFWWSQLGGCYLQWQTTGRPLEISYHAQDSHTTEDPTTQWLKTCITIWPQILMALNFSTIYWVYALSLCAPLSISETWTTQYFHAIAQYAGHTEPCKWQAVCE